MIFFVSSTILRATPSCFSRASLFPPGLHLVVLPGRFNIRLSLPCVFHAGVDGFKGREERGAFGNKRRAFQIAAFKAQDAATAMFYLKEHLKIT